MLLLEQVLTVPVIVLTTVSAILWVAVIIVALWHVYLGICGCRKMQMPDKIEMKTHLFGVLICARNEEAVIGPLLDSLQAQRYPRDHFDLFVVADNCTDRTAEVAREHGAHVFERFDTEHVGKGYALHWVFEKLLHEVPRTYEAFAIFDADNLVDEMFLYHANETLCTGVGAMQGYRETKNPFDSVVSGCYALYWYMLSRFYHQGRNNQGYPCTIGGTGFAFKRELIEKDGWQTTTLTEDSEFASRKVLEGHYIQFCRDALFYDEQPTTWGVSVKQRLRWTCGIMQESRALLKPAYRAWRGGNRNAFDIMMFLLGVPMLAVVFIASVTSLLAGVLSAMQLWDQWYIVIGGCLLSVLGSIYLTGFLLGLFSVLTEKGKVGRYWPAVLMYPVFMAPMTVFVFIGFFKTEMEWEQIRHIHTVSLRELFHKDSH